MADRSTEPLSPWRRNTKQRAALRSVFLPEDDPLAVAEILHRAQSIVPSLNEATVYRNLHVLVREGWLVQFVHPDIGTLYERSGKRHHHHFLCRMCQRVYDLAGCSLDAAKECPVGFVAEGHVAYFHGLCRDCAHPRPTHPRKAPRLSTLTTAKGKTP